MSTVSWNAFWAWVQAEPRIARVVELYERAHPLPTETLIPEGGRNETFRWRERTPTTQERLRELMRYLYMRVASGERRPLHSDAGLDGLWHALILETETYAAVCDKLGTFVHHRAGQFSDDPRWYTWFLSAYLDTFGEKPDFNVWPSVSDAEVEVDRAMRQQRDHDCA